MSKSEHESFFLLKQRVETLCKAAYKKNVRLLVDAECSFIQTAIDTVVEEMMFKYNKSRCVIYNTIQLYRKDRFQFLKEQHMRLSHAGCKTGFKLVRGAYLEQENNRAKALDYVTPINESKIITDKMFNDAIEYCIENIDTISLCVGTHNENSCHLLINLMKKKSISNNDQRIFFAQLKGMADHISYNLSKSNFNVAKYVPFGSVKEVMPYLIRRANENTSINGEISREFKMRRMERERRIQNI
jgi:proline dehydrogenase